MSPARGDAPLVVQAVNGLEPAGAERDVVLLAGQLREEGFRSHVVTVRGGPLEDELREAAVPFTVVGGDYGLRAALAVARTAAVLARLAPAVVHTHLIGSDVVARAAAILARAPHILSTQHDTYPRAWHLRAWRRATNRRVDAVVAVSDEVAAYCRAEIGTPPERVRVIPNGVSLDRFASVAAPASPPRVFGMLGTLVEVKNHATAIRALPLVRERVPDVRLRVAGDGRLRAGLEALAERGGVRAAVDFAGLVLDVPAFLAGVDALVHPSFSEGQGMAVLEAMAAGRPAVVSAIPVFEALGDAVSLVDPHRPEDVARGMLELATDARRAAALAVEGRGLVARRYSAERMVADHADLYRGLLGGGPGPLR